MKKKVFFALCVSSLLMTACGPDTPKEFTGITFSDKTVTYTGAAQTIELLGNLPEGAQVTYGTGGNSFTDVGVYNVTVTVTLDGYTTWTEAAKFTIEKATLEGVAMANSTATFDGQNHTIAPTGVPAGATVTYVGDHEFKNPGEYTIRAKVSLAGYNDVEVSAKLTINKADFSGIGMTDKTVDYNGQNQTIAPTGVPADATVTYTGDHEFKNPGEYTIKAKISKEGYNDKEVTAKLTINKVNVGQITFVDASVPYDGAAHTITPAGVPSDATFEYVGDHDFILPGQHLVKGKITGAGYNDKEVTATLTITKPAVASSPLVVDDFEGIGDSDLASDWELKFFDNDWVTPSKASVKIAKNETIGSGSQTMRMNISHQGAFFKATKTVEKGNTPKIYKGIALDAFADTVQSADTVLRVQLWLKDLPLPTEYQGYKDTYLTYTVADKLQTNWTHYEIPLNDASLSIANGAIPVSVLQQIGLTLDDISLYIDKIAVLACPNFVSGGPAAIVYVDNVQLTGTENAKSETKVNIANKSFTAKSSNDTVVKFTASSATACKVESLNLGSNFSFDGTYTVNGDQISVTIPTSATTSLVVPFTAKNNGTKLALGTPSGDLAAFASVQEHFAFAQMDQVVVVDNFDSYQATGQGYDRGHRDPTAVTGLRAAYYGEVYNETKPASGPIDAKWNLMNDTGWANYIKLEETGKSGKAMSIYNNKDWGTRYMTSSLVTGAQPIGRGEYLSMWVKGSVAQTMTVRAFYDNRITTSNQSATSGAVAYKNGIEVGTDWTQVIIPLDAKREVYGVEIVPTKANGTIYVDDIELFGEGDPYAEFVAPSYATVGDGTYVWSSGETDFTFEVSNGVTNASFKSGTTTMCAFKATMAEGKVTLKDNVTNGTQATVVLEIVDGNLKVESITGSQSSVFGSFVDKTFTKLADVVCDFQEEAKQNHQLVNSNWTSKKKSGSTWVDTTGQMNVRFSGDNVFCNMTAGYSTENMYTYAPADKIGLANHFSVDVANDFSGCTDISVKVKLILNDGTEKFILGTANDSAVIPANTGDRNNDSWYNVDLDFEDCDVKAVSVIVNSSKSGNDYLYFDNFQVSYRTAKDITPEPIPQVSCGDYYLWNGASDAFMIKINEGSSVGRIRKLGSADYPTVVTIDGDLIMIQDNDDGSHLKLIGTITDNDVFRINEVQGEMASMFTASLQNKSFKKCTGISLDFSEGSGNGSYTSGNWTATKYDNNSWVEFNQSLAMNSKTDKDGNKIINFKASDGIARKFIYTPDTAIGPVNHLDIDLGNYYTGGSKATIQYKIALLDNSGNVVKYICGSADEYATLAYDDSEGNALKRVSVDFDVSVGYKLLISTKCTGANFMYVDNINLSCK